MYISSAKEEIDKFGRSTSEDVVIKVITRVIEEIDLVVVYIDVVSGGRERNWRRRWRKEKTEKKMEEEQRKEV